MKKSIFASLDFIVAALTLVYRLGSLCSKMGKQVDGVPSFAHHSFLTRSAHWFVLLTRDWHTFPVSRDTKVHTHTMHLVFFFLTKVAGNSAISLQTKSSTLHVVSSHVSCRVASPLFSSVFARYTVEMIYRDKENACDMIIDYSNYHDYIVTPVFAHSY